MKNENITTRKPIKGLAAPSEYPEVAELKSAELLRVHDLRPDMPKKCVYALYVSGGKYPDHVGQSLNTRRHLLGLSSPKDDYNHVAIKMAREATGNTKISFNGEVDRFLKDPAFRAALTTAKILLKSAKVRFLEIQDDTRRADVCNHAKALYKGN